MSSASPATLRNLRLACNMSQEQVASTLHISRQCYGSYERGERAMPPDLLRICSRLYRHPELTAVSDGSPRLSEEEQDLLSCYRRLDTDAREQILSLIHYEAGAPAFG